MLSLGKIFWLVVILLCVWYVFKIIEKRNQNIATIPFELGAEKNINPFLRADDKNFTNSIGLKSSIPSECFSIIRKQKDNF